MLAALFIAILIGIILGIICGLIPGVHTNTVSAIIITLSPFLLEYFNPIALASMIATMGICQEAVNAIPATFLGAPESDNALSVLPSHELLMKGKGNEAILLSVAGSVASFLCSLALAVPMVILARLCYERIKPFIGFILIAICAFLLFKNNKKLWTMAIFAMSGTLGYFVLNMPGAKEPLLPLFSGMFGVSMLLLSWSQNTKIPEQEKPRLEIKKEYGKSAILATIAGWVCAFMPGLGPSQAAALVSQIKKSDDREEFIFLTSGLCASNYAISLITFYAIGKARNGAIVSISRLMESISASELALMLVVCLLAIGISALITPWLSRQFSGIICKVNYKMLCIGTISFIILLVIAISHAVGILIFVTATCLGIVTNIKGVQKSTMMGCLLVPVIIWFLLG